MHRILFGVEHDERNDPLVQAMICFGILLLLTEQHLVDMKSSCIAVKIIVLQFFGVEHDERNDPLVQTMI